MQNLIQSILLVSDASLSSAGDVLIFHDMAGVFYAVLFGLALSLFTLMGELTWVARKDNKQDQVGQIIEWNKITCKEPESRV